MEPREALLAAADQIEHEPSSFDYMSVQVPSGLCGSPGCALGWIAYFLDASKGRSLGAAEPALFEKMGIGPDVAFPELTTVFGSTKWTSSALKCAEGLRMYADAKWPATEVHVQVGIPDDVLAIFDQKLSLDFTKIFSQ